MHFFLNSFAMVFVIFLPILCYVLGGCRSGVVMTHAKMIKQAFSQNSNGKFNKLLNKVGAEEIINSTPINPSVANIVSSNRCCCLRSEK